MNAQELMERANDGHVCELVRGELKMMSPAGGRQGRVANRISWLLNRYVQQNELGIFLAAETGFRLSTSPDTVRAPDVAFVTSARDAAIDDEVGYLPLAPDLAVEVLSPCDRFSDVEEKVLCWLEHSCPMVLVVDPAQETVMVYRTRSDIKILRDNEELSADPIVAGWRVAIDDFFARPLL
jgi:Uma2 family endonuclease